MRPFTRLVLGRPPWVAGLPSQRENIPGRATQPDTTSRYRPALTADPRHPAWDDIHAALPDGMHLRPASYDPGTRSRTVVARSPQPVGRRGRPEYLEGRGEDEMAALTYLVLALQERRHEGLRAENRARGRLAYVEGAEESSRRTRGRGLTGDELERVTEEFGGR